jgi:hypothetical protein
MAMTGGVVPTVGVMSISDALKLEKMQKQSIEFQHAQQLRNREKRKRAQEEDDEEEDDEDDDEEEAGTPLSLSMSLCLCLSVSIPLTLNQKTVTRKSECWNVNWN